MRQVLDIPSCLVLTCPSSSTNNGPRFGLCKPTSANTLDSSTQWPSASQLDRQLPAQTEQFALQEQRVRHEPPCIAMDYPTVTVRHCFLAMSCHPCLQITQSHRCNRVLDMAGLWSFHGKCSSNFGIPRTSCPATSGSNRRQVQKLMNWWSTVGTNSSAHSKYDFMTICSCWHKWHASKISATKRSGVLVCTLPRGRFTWLETGAKGHQTWKWTVRIIIYWERIIEQDTKWYVLQSISFYSASELKFELSWMLVCSARPRWRLCKQKKMPPGNLYNHCLAVAWRSSKHHKSIQYSIVWSFSWYSSEIFLHNCHQLSGLSSCVSSAILAPSSPATESTAASTSLQKDMTCKRNTGVQLSHKKRKPCFPLYCGCLIGVLSKWFIIHVYNPRSPYSWVA